MTADCATIQHLKKTPSFNFVCSGQTVKTNGRKMNGFSSDDDDDAAFLFWIKKPSGPFFIFKKLENNEIRNKLIKKNHSSWMSLQYYHLRNLDRIARRLNESKSAMSYFGKQTRRWKFLQELTGKLDTTGISKKWLQICFNYKNFFADDLIQTRVVCIFSSRYIQSVTSDKMNSVRQVTREIWVQFLYQLS